MILKPRKIPASLQLRHYLRHRMSFTDGELKKLQADEKGFEGECHFDELISQSPVSTYLQLNDLLLEWRNTTFQIDSLLISPYKIYLFDIKNYEGEFYIEGNRWYLSSGNEIKNPIPQIHRLESFLRPLIQTLGINLPIEASVIFVNPDFTLYQATRHLPIILPTQINSFIKRLGSVSMNSSGHLIDLAKKLGSLHIENSPYDGMYIPEYTYESLNKGVLCLNCGLLSVRLNGRGLMCERCGEKEELHVGIMRTIKEYRMLFPQRQITVSAANDWCRLGMTRLRMQKILKEQLVMVKGGKSTYYCFR
ncbi:nuclease-related domain-containing protein [Metabacillus sp. B2-18]|uniref:nuclease-related domain-containing protein n=1 Tax=Metabacillus sp. B2-18 TaxID=2897333 RepID=UPI001E5CD2F3|nr:nuclease-related domain-containing protein [Metabacillus sp. B2-18]UGB31301.1 NERD domain-containing protein [Metabacillus sp. B2-18]